MNEFCEIAQLVSIVFLKKLDQRANGRILDNMMTTLVREDSSKLKCYDSGEWKTLVPQKELACPYGTCKGTWITEPGKLYCKGV